MKNYIFIFFTLFSLASCAQKKQEITKSNINSDTLSEASTHLDYINNLPNVKSGNYSGNPIFRGDTLTSDPNAVVYNGRLYVYMTSDQKAIAGENGDYAKMKDWWVSSTTDMVNWTKLKKILSIEDLNWKSSRAWAATSAYCSKTKKYLFYYSCFNAQNKFVTGVSESNSPDGVYTNHKIMIDANQYGIDWGIDPAVFVNDDGKAYIYTKNACAQLADDFTAILPNTIIAINQLNFPQGRNNYNQEGPFIFKRNNLYYLFFASNGYQYLEYFIATAPQGPFDYKGLIMDKDIKKPGFTANNHGSVVAYKGKFYLFYHRHIDVKANRRLCAEEIMFDGDKIITSERSDLGLKLLK